MSTGKHENPDPSETPNREDQPQEEITTEAQHGTSSNEVAESTPGAAPAFFEYWNQMDMLSWMGARITASSDGQATVYFEPDSHHRGAGIGGRAVTGAVQAYIFDIVTGAAVASLAHGRKPQVTVTLDVTFERPAYEAPLTFVAHVQSGGTQIFFVEGVCYDSNGNVCSRAHAIYRRFDRRIQVPERLREQLPENLQEQLKAGTPLESRGE
jgi:acyl-coenzyme A thioesterase PaaI-like protein